MLGSQLIGCNVRAEAIAIRAGKHTKTLYNVTGHIDLQLAIHVPVGRPTQLQSAARLRCNPALPSEYTLPQVLTAQLLDAISGIKGIIQTNHTNISIEFRKHISLYPLKIYNHSQMVRGEINGRQSNKLRHLFHRRKRYQPFDL